MQIEVLELLAREAPLFQLKSGERGLSSAEGLFLEQGGTETSRFERASAALPAESLSVMDRLLRPDHVTLEVGGGHSTVLFAASVANHYCVNPDKTANRLIREFMESHGLWRDNLCFIEESSDHALPRFEAEDEIDVALLDGNHSFPFPMLEWHYVDRKLRRGGWLIVDNVEITAVRMLCEFLRSEPAYRLVEKARGSHRYDCHVYEKVADQVVSGWSAQGINHSSLMRLSLDASITNLWKPLQRLRRRIAPRKSDR